MTSSTSLFVKIKQIDSTLSCVCSINKSQKTSKCGKNFSDTLGYRIVCHVFATTFFWGCLWGNRSFPLNSGDVSNSLNVICRVLIRDEVVGDVLKCSIQSPQHSRPQSLRSFWPAAGIERLWEQPLQACAIDEDFVKPDGQNSVISFVISKRVLPELSIPAVGQKDRRLWVRECLLNLSRPRYVDDAPVDRWQRPLARWLHPQLYLLLRCR